ncbi:MAG: hypothetical protein IT273_09145 [Chitinophagales bacterium]|nr:hypothetical protein [Chitinophagales bacterium]
MAGIQKEIWVDQLIGRDGEFYKDSSVIKHMRNMTGFVEYNRINLAYSGVPGAVERNPTYPRPVVQRTDTPDFVELDNYATEAIMVRDIETIELAYNKRESYLSDTRDNLAAKIEIDCMWNLGPTSDSSHTPIVQTPGTNALAADGYRVVTAEDIKRLRKQLNTKYPAHKNDAWVLVLDAESYWSMVANDTHLKNQQALNQQTGVRDGVFVRYFGFDIIEDNRTPWYAAGGVKLGLGATPVLASDCPSCIAYVKGKSGYYALGTTKMFANLDNPIEQGSIWSFLTRAKVGMFGAFTGQETLCGAILRTT